MKNQGKKGRQTRAKSTARSTPKKKPVAKAAAAPAAPVAAPADEKSAARARPKRGLGTLGMQSLDRALPALVFIPSSATAPAASPPPRTPAATSPAGPAGREGKAAELIYLRDELRTLLALFDDPSPSH